MYSSELYSPYTSRGLGTSLSSLKARSCLDVVAPPPNVTGDLHVGHALNVALQRALAAYEARRRRRVRFVLGADHAGIAVRFVIASRCGDASARRFWTWKKRVAARLLTQLEALLAASACSKRRFTLDAPFGCAVSCAFVKLWKAGLISRRRRALLWDGALASAISKLETVEKPEWRRELKWKFVLPRGVCQRWDGGWVLSNYVSALRPADELVVASVVVDVNSFCGCRLAARHVVDAASAESVRLLVNARSGANSFGALADLKLSACASLLMACAMSVRAPASTFATAGVCAPQRQLAGVLYGEKTGHRVERAVSVQWFVSLRALAALQPLAGLKIKPASWRGLLNTWMTSLGLWCVSRHMAWGHRLPVWWADDGFEVRDSEHKARYYAILRCGAFGGLPPRLSRDVLVLDTWFSSALWRLSCLGWPHKTKQLRTAYGLGVVFTGYDILFFWIVKMLLVSSWLMRAKLPFKTVIVHPVVCDAAGAKMSKTRGNAVPPNALINAYGLNAVCAHMFCAELKLRRLSLSSSQMAHNRNLVTKLWNVARAGCDSKRCEALACKLAAGAVFDRFRAVDRAMSRFDVSVGSRVLAGLVKHTLGKLADARGRRCACASRLARCVWQFYWPCANAFGAPPPHTRFVKAGALAAALAALPAGRVIATNCDRLFLQARGLLAELTAANVYYFKRLRLSPSFKPMLWNNSLVLVAS